LGLFDLPGEPLGISPSTAGKQALSTLATAKRLATASALHTTMFDLTIRLGSCMNVNRILRGPQMTISAMRRKPSANRPKGIDPARNGFQMLRIYTRGVLAHMIDKIAFGDGAAATKKSGPVRRRLLAIMCASAIAFWVQVKRPRPAIITTLILACIVKRFYSEFFVVGDAAQSHGTILPGLFIAGGLFDFITKPIKSALTAPGTNAAASDAKAKKKPQQMAHGYLSALDPLISNQIAFANRIEPGRQRAVEDLMWAGTPNGVNATVENARRGFMGGAISALPIMRQRLSQGGAGIGAMQGAEISGINNATSQGNDLLSWLLSPEGRTALARMRLGAAGMAMPDLSNFGNLSNVVYGRPAPQVGPSPLAGIANAAGMLFGGGMFGGGGGGQQMVGGGYMGPGQAM